MKAETFDEKFETGEDITQYLDLTGIRRPGQGCQTLARSR